jgi:hypothetical protein
MEKGDQLLLDYFKKITPKIDNRKRRNRFYENTIDRQFDLSISEESTVLRLGYSLDNLLNTINPSKSVWAIIRKLSLRLPIRNILISKFDLPILSNLFLGLKLPALLFLNQILHFGKYSNFLEAKKLHIIKYDTANNYNLL